ncbi:MAG: TRAP transporter large permease subunit [Rhizobiales bacterium]|nr:TRAP transporter large permease subunit [Hyphomicrobiales bacterium]
MEIVLYITLFFGGLAVLLLVGLPVAIAFTFVNLVGVYVFWGGAIGFSQLILSIDSSVSTFVLVPVPMFILMGTMMFHSGVAYRLIDVLDQWLGRIAGRLAVLAVAAGALFATLTGVAIGSVAMLGSTLVPDMERRGYSRTLALGSVLASGSLAILIPPSALAVILASLGKFSVGKLLIGIIVPGILLACVYAIYIVLRCTLQPSLAPPYAVERTPMVPRLRDTLIYVVPPLSMIGLVIGTIFAGIATPTEAAAIGTLLSFVVAAGYGKLTWPVIKQAVGSATSLSVMVLLVLTGSAAFSQLLSFSGVTPAITAFAVGMDVHPIVVLILMQLVVMVLGMFIEQTAIVLVTIPIFMPIVATMGWDPIWFGAIMMLNLEMATITPPFGLSLFVMKGIAPPGTTMGEVYRAALPFVGLNLVVMALMILFPDIVLWLPAQMR